MRLIEFRNSHQSFDGSFRIDKASGSGLILTWENADHISRLSINLDKREAYIEYSENGNMKIYKI
jgi:hypothetical protein